MIHTACALLLIGQVMRACVRLLRPRLRLHLRPHPSLETSGGLRRYYIRRDFLESPSLLVETLAVSSVDADLRELFPLLQKCGRGLLCVKPRASCVPLVKSLPQ